jgi:hypothetical protein
MNLINRAALCFALGLALAIIAGCSGNTALVGRDTLPARATQPVPDEIVATVERVDTWSREIHLRPNRGGSTVVAYGDETRLIYRGHEYPVSQLKIGDIVAMQVEVEKNARGKPYTALIRVQESTGDRSQGRNY